jgi:DNA-binding NtrC family response regulator
MPHILIIERDDRARALLQCRLASNGSVKATYAACVESAGEKLTRRKFDLVLWNSCSDPTAKSDFCRTLEALAGKTANTRTIVLTDEEKPSALEARGDFLRFCRRPAGDEDIFSLIVSGLREPRSERNGTRVDDSVAIEFEGIIAAGLPMRGVIRRILDAATVDIPVLITGETGTGKDLIAAAIHKRSSRKDRPYLAINMGAMSRELIASEIFGHERGAYTGAQDTRPGIFEQGDGGTVFLDEIATMDEKTQVSLLRVLEEKTFRRVGGVKSIGADVRIIAATNEDLEKQVEEKRFREDLFYRLNVFHISVPPLRERPGAVTLLTDYFLSHFAVKYGKEVERVSPETYRLLRHYPWPGNVRELKNVVQTAVLMVDGTELTPDFIPPRIHGEARCDSHAETVGSFRVGSTLDAVEKELIRLTLASAGGNKKLTAHILGVSRRALYNKLKRHRLL